MAFRCGKFTLSFDRPLLMGIVNLTPDSFSGDGVSSDCERAIAYAWQQIESGADILDLGAESSRPGAIPTSESEELERLLPVLRALAGCGVPISVDTYKSVVMRAALDAGADMINDITGFRDAEAIDAVANSNCGLCVMHMQGEPLTMQVQPAYVDVVAEVQGFLAARINALRANGVATERLMLDPGFGFGKTLPDNLSLFRAIGRFAEQGYPVLVGVSRKSMLGAITGQPVGNRLAASVAAAALAAERGASVLRVHDVAETKDALAVWQAVKNTKN